MLKASALYIVIIIALVIGVLCSSLILAAYFYNIQYQQKNRYDRLANNVSSGGNLLLAGNDTSYSREQKFNLFNNDVDSVSLKRFFWGLYDIGVSKAFIQKDTLYKIFSIGNAIDSSKWAALYLIDEDRPFSLSGKTSIIGDVFIPKGGVQTAYVANQAYDGDKRLIIGNRHFSEKTLPPLNQIRLNSLRQYLNRSPVGETTLPATDSIVRSFLFPTLYFNFKKKAETIQNVKLSGNIMLYSDTTITIDNTAILNNVMVFAKAIVVKSGFRGSCQLFATDSICIENNCRFNYPSGLGTMQFQSSIVSKQEKISIGDNTEFTGILFTYEETKKPIMPMIETGKGVKITGQVYSQGIMELKDNVEIDGSIFTSLFLYKNPFTLFENYLINTIINSKALSPYYLTSGLMPVAGKKKKALQWLDAN